MIAKLVKAFTLLRKDFADLKINVDSIEKAKPAKDGISPDINEIVAQVLSRIPPAKDGETPDINLIATEAAKLIPNAQPGRDGISPTVRDIADVVLANLEKPKDGISPDPKTIAAAAARLIPKPKNGTSPSAQEVAAVLPTPKRGLPGTKGKDGVSVTDVQLNNNELFVFLDGKKQSAGSIKVPMVPFRPGGNDSGGGGGSKTIARPKYFETHTTARVTKAPGPVSTVDQMSLQTANGSQTYRTEAQVQFQSLPEFATPVLLANLVALKAEINALPNKVSHVAGFGNGEVLTPGVYTVSSASTHEGVLTFDAEGDTDALFVMIINGAEALAVGATSELTNGAQSSNVFWLVTGALTFGSGCDIKGSYLGSGAISAAGLILDGRILTPTGAVALTESNITVPGGTTSLNLGFLTTFILFTNAGALSNTVVTSGIVGSVASGLGAISGFPNLDGNIYTSNSNVVSIDFIITSNGEAIESSTVSYQTVQDGQGAGFFDVVHLAGISSKPIAQTIEIKVLVILGSIIIGNRNLFCYEI